MEKYITKSNHDETKNSIFEQIDELSKLDKKIKTIIVNKILKSYPKINACYDNVHIINYGLGDNGVFVNIELLKNGECENVKRIIFSQEEWNNIN